WENEETNSTITPSISGAWVSGPERTPMEVEVVDDYTFKLKFALPNPLAIFSMGRLTNNLYQPGHYMAQFHMDLTDDPSALEADTQAAGFNSWEEYYVDRSNWYQNPDKPSVGAWLARNSLSNELFIMERNPYFFAV